MAVKLMEFYIRVTKININYSFIAFEGDVISTSPMLYYLGTPRAYNVCLPLPIS